MVTRRFGPPDRYTQYVRQVKGSAYQCRPLMDGGLRWNLGLYHPDDYPDGRGKPDRGNAISAANYAGEQFMRRVYEREILSRREVAAVAISEDVQRLIWAWAVTQELQRATRFGRPIVPVGVLPPGVRRLDGGYVGVCRRQERRGKYLLTHRETIRPAAGRVFLAPLAAYFAVAAHLARAGSTRFGSRSPSRRVRPPAVAAATPAPHRASRRT